MADRPILFGGPMVLAILAGKKTQTRRIIPEPKVAKLHGRHSVPERHFADPGFGDGGYLHWAYSGGDLGDDVMFERQMFRANVGCQLWVRETLRQRDALGWRYAADDALIEMDRNDPRALEMFSWAHHKEGDTCVSIHMPRWASRITLEVTSVRVERLNDISEEDAKAEGVQPAPFCKAGRTAGLEHVEAFEDLWERINGARPGCSWDANPWVWVVSFRRLAP